MNLYINQDLTEKAEQLVIEGEQLHHFRNVLRGRSGDDVRIFDGIGTIAEGHVLSVSKKELIVKVNSLARGSGFSTIEQLTIGVPKKEYLESILRTATQTGVKTVNLVQTKFSPWVYKSYPRLEKILISSLLQCENPYLPNINFYSSIEEFLQLRLKTLLFSTELDDVSEISSIEGSFENIFIGPEGGFHQSELNAFKEDDKVTCLRLAAPIMKAETAASFCLGLSSFFK